MEIIIKEQHIELLPEKACFWKEEGILAVSDLHLGKTATFRRAGIPVPDAVMLHDLEKLTQLLQVKQAKRCLVVGDFLHHPTGLTEQTVKIIDDWLVGCPCPVDLILGNHDRALKSHWQMTIHQQAFFLAPFAFSHIHTDFAGFFTWSGHIHPQVLIADRRKTIRVPCFLLGRSSGLLPAFSSFAGGFNIKKGVDDRIFAIADNSVVEL